MMGCYWDVDMKTCTTISVLSAAFAVFVIISAFSGNDKGEKPPAAATAGVAPDKAVAPSPLKSVLKDITFKNTKFYYSKNPAIVVTEAWECNDFLGDYIEQAVSVFDPVDSRIIRIVFDAGAHGFGYAYTATKEHFPMQSKYTSLVKDIEGDKTKVKISSENNGVVGEPGASIVYHYRSSAVSAADCLSQNWLTYKDEPITLNKYAQIRILVRTTNPFSSMYMSNVSVSDSLNLNWQLGAEGEHWNGTCSEGLAVDSNFILTGQKCQAPFQVSKYWANPVQGIFERDAYINTSSSLQFDSSVNLYKMWINRNDGNGHPGWHIGYATSPDLITWTVNPDMLNLSYDGCTSFVDPAVIKYNNEYHMYTQGGGSRRLYYAKSADGITNWTNWKMIWDGFFHKNKIFPCAVSALKINDKLHIFAEAESNDFWDTYYGKTTFPDGAIPSLTKITERTNTADWRELYCTFPALLYDGKNIFGWFRGASKVGFATSSPTYKEPDTPALLQAGVARIDVTSSDTYAGKGYSFKMPKKVRLRSLLIETSEPEGYAANGNSVSGAKTIQVALGTSKNEDGILTGSEIDVLAASPEISNTAMQYKPLPAQYAVNYMDGPTGTKYFASETTYYFNIRAKAAIVSGIGIRQVHVPFKVWGVLTTGK